MKKTIEERLADLEKRVTKIESHKSITGHTGETGPAGPKGEKGDEGATGPKGGFSFGG